MEELRRVSIEIYQRGADHAAERGIILADTKFEFGTLARRRDRARRRGADARTPRASGRPTTTSPAGRSPRSTSSTSATTPTRSAGTTPPPGPELPDEVVENTRAKYVEAYERITERKLDG